MWGVGKGVCGGAGVGGRGIQMVLVLQCGFEIRNGHCLWDDTLERFVVRGDLIEGVDGDLIEGVDGADRVDGAGGMCDRGTGCSGFVWKQWNIAQGSSGTEFGLMQERCIRFGEMKDRIVGEQLGVLGQWRLGGTGHGRTGQERVSGRRLQYRAW